MACAAGWGVILGLQVVESPPLQAPSLGVREPITGTKMLSCPISASLEVAPQFALVQEHDGPGYQRNVLH